MRKFRHIPDDISEYLRYNPENGTLTWTKAPGSAMRNCLMGEAAGGINPTTGYRMVYFRGHHYGQHRVVWKMVRGEDPGALDVDHIDRDRANNRIENLRLASRGKNCMNGPRRATNKSGYKGVHWHKACRMWVAKISVDKKRLHLGYFSTPELAHAAYVKAAAEAHGEFARFS